MEFNRLLQIRRIYAQSAALELPRGREIVERWPDAEVVLVENHWNIPEVHGEETNVPRWSRIKTEALVLGVKKSLSVKPNVFPVAEAGVSGSLESKPASLQEGDSRVRVGEKAAGR